MDATLQRALPGRTRNRWEDSIDDQHMGTAPQIEVGDGRYTWLTEHLFLGRTRPPQRPKPSHTSYTASAAVIGAVGGHTTAVFGPTGCIDPAANASASAKPGPSERPIPDLLVVNLKSHESGRRVRRGTARSRRGGSPCSPRRLRVCAARRNRGYRPIRPAPWPGALRGRSGVQAPRRTSYWAHSRTLPSYPLRLCNRRRSLLRGGSPTGRRSTFRCQL